MLVWYELRIGTGHLCLLCLIAPLTQVTLSISIILAMSCHKAWGKWSFALQRNWWRHKLISINQECVQSAVLKFKWIQLSCMRVLYLAFVGDSNHNILHLDESQFIPKVCDCTGEVFRIIKVHEKCVDWPGNYIILVRMALHSKNWLHLIFMMSGQVEKKAICMIKGTIMGSIQEETLLTLHSKTSVTCVVVRGLLLRQTSQNMNWSPMFIDYQDSIKTRMISARRIWECLPIGSI